MTRTEVRDLAATRRTWSPGTSFWLVVGAQVLLFAGSNFPTPLFPVYERRYGFSSGVVTLLFGVYVLALIPSMLTLGRVTDRIGRRPALVTGISITAVSSVAFAADRGVGWLFAGEVIYGIGAGLVMSAVSVTIRELHPKQSVAAGALAASMAAAVGLAIGPTLSGLLATFAPWPTAAPFLLDVVLATALAAALVRIPETRPQQLSGPVGTRPPVLHVPVDIRRAFLATTLAGATGWMLLGWIFGLGPSYLHDQLHVQITQPVVAGLFATLAVVSNGVAQLALRRLEPGRALRYAMGAEVAGMALIAGATVVDSLALALVGAVVGGGGVGVGQMATMATIQRIAPAHARGGVFSAFLTACYLAMSVPVVVAGLTADGIGLGVVTAWYLVGLTCLVAAALVATARAMVTPSRLPMATPCPAQAA